MDDRSCHPRPRLAIDAAVALFFVLLDTAMTVAGTSWWPAHPGPLAWVLLGTQALACASLVGWRRFPVTVVLVMAGFTLLVSLLVWPLHALTPAHDQEVWAPYAMLVAAYGPVAQRRSRRTVLLLIAVLTVTVARPWEASMTLITIGVLRTAVGPLLALYFDARRRLVRALTERAERAERERHLLAEQARAEERASWPPRCTTWSPTG